MLLAALPLALSLATATPVPPEDAAAALSAGLQRSRPALRAAALALAPASADGALVEAIASALTDPDEEVRIAALAALGRCRSPLALDALLARASSGTDELRTHPREQAQLFRALGLHGDPRALRTLATDTLQSLETEPLRARILALGRIRTRESVDALVALARSLPFAEEQQVLHELRLSFAVLTGEAPGRTAASLVRWWGERRASFVVPEATPQLAPPSLRRWNAAWPELAAR